MSSIASVPNYDNSYNNLATMSNRQSTTNYPPWPPATPTSDSHHMHHISQSHANSAHQSQAPTPTTMHHQDPSNITPPPTATTASRSGTSSPPRAAGMTPETRDRRLANQMRRDSKTVTRLKRANSNPYGADISSGPPSAGLTGSVYGSPQGPSTGGMPMLSESDPAPMQSPSYIQYSPSSIQGSGHYNGYQSPHLPPYGMPMSYDFNHPQQNPYSRSRHPPSNLPMDPSSMMYGTVPSMISPGMPPTPHSHGHSHVAHQQHPHPHHAVSPSHMGGPDNNVRVVQTRPKPQCWEHGCNGRQFSTFSNLLRHQREKSGQAAKATCPNCGAEFTRTTARNGHLLHDKCKKRNNAATSQASNTASINNTNSTTVVAQQGQQQPAPSE